MFRYENSKKSVNIPTDFAGSVKYSTGNINKKNIYILSGIFPAKTF